MKEKVKLVLALLALLLMINTVIAAYWVYSNIVSVTVSAFSFESSLTIDDEAPVQYQNITFSGTLYEGSSAVDSGCNVTLFEDGVPVAWNLTNATGGFSIVYNVTITGLLNFTAGYKVTP